jgi:hypothetical protein
MKISAWRRHKLASLSRNIDGIHDFFTLARSVFMRPSCTISYRARVIRQELFSVFFGLPQHSADALERWLDSLYLLSRNDWLAIGRSDGIRAIPHSERDIACNAVSAAIADRGLQLTAWFVRDVIETAAWYAVSIGASASRTSGRFGQLDEARSHAEWAALAIATRSWLADGNFRLLYGPFNNAQIVPLTSSTIFARRQAILSTAGDQPSLSPARGD